MYFVDMLQMAGESSRYGSKIPFVCPEGITTGGVYLNEGNKLVVGENGKNVFSEGIGSEAMCKVSKLTAEELADTAENPIIIVRCSKISLFYGQPVGVKFLYCGDEYMLAALVYGVCVFNDVPLQRCNTQDLNTMKVGKVIEPKDLSVLVVSLTDEESGYNYLSDCVFHLHMCVATAKDGTSSFKMSCPKSLTTIFDNSGIEVERQKKAAAKAKAEQERKELAEKRAKQMAETEERRRIAAEKAAEDEAKKLQEKQERKKLKVVGAKPSEEKVACGPKDFLAAMREISKNS